VSSLGFLADAAEEDALREKEMSEIRAELEKSDEDELDDVAIDEQVLAKSINDDEDGEKSRRLANAIKRAEALRMECAWHFFEKSTPKSAPRRPPFPSSSLPTHAWRANFEGQTHLDVIPLHTLTTTRFAQKRSVLCQRVRTATVPIHRVAGRVGVVDDRST
jgi:hypothetical protein